MNKIDYDNCPHRLVVEKVIELNNKQLEKLVDNIEKSNNFLMNLDKKINEIGYKINELEDIKNSFVNKNLFLTEIENIKSNLNDFKNDCEKIKKGLVEKDSYQIQIQTITKDIDLLKNTKQNKISLKLVSIFLIVFGGLITGANIENIKSILSLFIKFVK